MAVIAGMAWLLGPRLVWDGAAVRLVHLTLIDDRTSRPIAGASIQHKGRIACTTDENGVCQWLGTFGAGGQKTIFGRSGNWVVGGELKIMTPDGRTQTFELRDFVSEPRRSLSDEEPVEVVVRLDAIQ